MRGTSALLAALLASATLSAQVKVAESPAVLFDAPMSSGCPIGISAERRSSVAVSTVGSAPGRTLSQGLQLRFSRLFTPGIEGVTVVVHGLSGKTQMMPAGIDSSDVAESFHLNRAGQAASLSASYIEPKRVRTTQWVELTSVDYTDGTTWHESSGGQCKVTPSNFVLVAGR